MSPQSVLPNVHPPAHLCLSLSLWSYLALYGLSCLVTFTTSNYASTCCTLSKTKYRSSSAYAEFRPSSADAKFPPSSAYAEFVLVQPTLNFHLVSSAGPRVRRCWATYGWCAGERERRGHRDKEREREREREVCVGQIRRRLNFSVG